MHLLISSSPSSHHSSHPVHLYQHLNYYSSSRQQSLRISASSSSSSSLAYHLNVSIFTSISSQPFISLPFTCRSSPNMRILTSIISFSLLPSPLTCRSSLQHVHPFQHLISTFHLSSINHLPAYLLHSPISRSLQHLSHLRSL